jgi:CheY-like chemotaxis protein
MEQPVPTQNDSLASLSGARVLAIEDNPEIARLTQIILAAHGCDVKVANIADYALELLESEVFDLIILDIMLPEMDGYELLAEMKRRFGISPKNVIMMSALREEKDLARAQEAGVSAYVTKPFTHTQLTSAVAKYLANARKS